LFGPNITPAKAERNQVTLDGLLMLVVKI